MTVKRNNLFFMLFAILFTGGAMLAGVLLPRWGLSSVVPYLICFVIGLKMLKKDGTPLSSVLPFRVPPKAVTLLLTVALVFLLMPLSDLLSSLGAALGGDFLSGLTQRTADSSKPFIERLFETAIVPAVFEEMYFRGFFYAGFKRARGTRFAILFTAVVFGVFHANLQQMLYAVMLGAVIAVLRELTGSMWAGCLFHFVNNGWFVPTAALSAKASTAAIVEKLPMERILYWAQAGQTPSAGTRVYSWAMLAVCTALAAFVLCVIARREGHWDTYKRFFKNADAPKERVITVPLIIGCVFLLGLLITVTFAMRS